MCTLSLVVPLRLVRGGNVLSSRAIHKQNITPTFVTTPAETDTR